MTPSDRRALVLGSLALAGGLAGLRVAPRVVRSAYAAVRDVQERALLVARERREVDGANALGDSAEALTHALSQLGPDLLSGDTRPEAQADLGDRLSLLADPNRVRVERSDQLPDSEVAGRLRSVRTRMALEGDVRGLTTFLKALADGVPVLVATELRIVAPDPWALSSGAEALKTEVTIAGWYLGKIDPGQRGLPSQ